MLRREADGIGYHVRRQALLRRKQPAPTLALSLTLHAKPKTVSKLIWDLAALLESRTLELGVRLPRQKLTVWVWGREEFVADWTGQSQTEAAERAADDRAAMLLLEWADASVPGEAVQLSAILAMHQDRNREGLWGVSLMPLSNLRQAAVPLLDQLAELLVDGLAVAGSSPDLVYGAVVFDFIGGETLHRLPYELVFGITEGYQEADEYARGYYWANLLTARHLDKLGGLAAFTARCAERSVVATVIDRESATSATHGAAADDDGAGAADAAVLVRDPAPLTAFSDERLAAMRDLLDPALQHPAYRWYAGWPLRVFMEPGTAFRPVPPDIVEPWFEDDGPLPSAGTAYRLVPDA